MRLSAEQLDGEGFAPFGSIIESTTAGPDATGAGWRWWAETALLEPGERPYAIGYLELEPLRPLGFVFEDNGEPTEREVHFTFKGGDGDLRASHSKVIGE